MSPVRLIILLVAAVAAIGAVFLVRSVQHPAPAVAAAPVEKAKPKEIPLNEVLVANTTIPVGKFVSADDLRWQEWPAQSPTDSFFDKQKSPDALQKFVGAVARTELAKGEPVTAAKLVQPGTSGFMSVMLTPGMRAVSIEIRPEAAAGGFIQPNDRVDVLVTRTLEDKSGGAGHGGKGGGVRSDVVLANIRVLAIDGVYGAPLPEAEGQTRQGQGQVLIGSRATLELAERDAVLLNTAKKAGEISLTLRSVADLDQPQGVTGPGRTYRQGVAEEIEGVRVYRYGKESVSSASAS